MADDGIIIESEAFARDVAQFALLTGRSFADELKQQARGVMRGIIRVTPPFSAGATVSSAKKTGENAIRGDLSRIFRSVNLVGSRKVTHLFGKDAEGAPWTVPEKEKHPDLGAIYSRQKSLKSKGRQAIYRKPYYVDSMKLQALEAKLKKRVGFLGGGFAASGEALNVPLPSFMKRHRAQAPGAIQMKLEGDNLSIIMTNSVRYASLVSGFARRVEWAVEAQRGKMERQIPFLIRRHEKLIN
jgi:hypothetical protein